MHKEKNANICLLPPPPPPHIYESDTRHCHLGRLISQVMASFLMLSVNIDHNQQAGGIMTENSYCDSS